MTGDLPDDISAPSADDRGSCPGIERRQVPRRIAWLCGAHGQQACPG